MIDQLNNKKMSKSVTTNLMTNKTSKSRSRLVRFLTAGMMSSSILAMTTSYRKLSRKRLVIKLKSLSRSRKIKTGGGPSEISSI
jgi:hypothetical protein